MANDPNDFWGKGTPSGQPEDPNKGFWNKAKKDEPKAEPPKPVPPPKSGEEGGFWGSGHSRLSSEMNKPAADKPADPAHHGFWSKAEDKKKQDVAYAAVPDDQKRLARKRRKRKILWISLGSLALLFVLLVALAPTIAGWVAPGIIAGQAGKQISGKVSVESTSFGWFSHQRVTGLHLMDKDGKEIARASLDAEAGLASLITGRLNIGEVTLSGVKADIVRYPDGTTNLEKAVAPKQPAKPGKPAPSKPGEPQIPDSLNAYVVAHNMQLTFTDLGKPASPQPIVTLRSADLDAKVAAGAPLSVTFSGDAVTSDQIGKLAVNIKADKLIRKDGVIQPDKATLDADLLAKGVPLALVDAFVSLGEGASAEKLGKTIDITLKANGSLKEAKATLTASAANLSANADLRVADSILTTQSPIDVTIKGAAIRGLVPAIDKSLEQSKDTATVTSFPDAHLTVRNLKLPIPAGGALNLKGAAASITLALSETAGTVKLTGDKQSPFRIAPLETRIETTDLAKDAHVTAATTATINGQPAGNVNVDVTVAGLLDANGAPVKGPPGSVQGSLAVKQIATAIAQPFVEAMKIKLPEDIGPTLDIEARANSDLHAAAAGGTPPTDITLSVQSQGLKVGGALKLTETGIATTGDGLKIEVLTAAQMAQRFVGPETGWKVAAAPGAGGAVITVKGLNVPRNAGGMQLDKAEGAVNVGISGLALQSLKSPGSAPIEVRSLALAAQLASGGNAKIDLNSAMAYSGQNFGAQGNFDVPGLIVPGAAGKTAVVAPPEQLRPVGKLEIKDLPTALAKAVLPPPAPVAPPAAAPPAVTPGAPPPSGVAAVAGGSLDLAKLLADVLGPSVTVALNTAAVPGSPDTINAAVSVKSATTTAEVNADVGKTQLALKKLDVQANVTPQTVSGLAAAFAPNVAGVPRLAGPSKLVVQADPITIPLKDYQPQLDRVGQASVKIALPGKTIVDGLVMTNPDGTKRDLGRVGVDSLEFVAKIPVGALMGPVLPEERRALVTMSGTVLGSDNAPMLELSGRAQADLSDRKLMGGLVANIKVDKVNTQSIERLTGQEGLLTGALGNTASMELAANITPPAAAPGQNPDMSKATGDATLTLTAPHLHTEGPIRAVLDAGSVRVDKPVKLTMDLDPAFVNKFLEPKPQPGAKGPPPKAAVRFTDPAAVTVTIANLVYPRPGAADPAPLSAALGVAIPSLKMVSSDNQAIRLSQLGAQLKAEAAKAGSGAPMSAVPVTFRVDVAEAAVGEQPTAKALTLSGSVTDLVDSRAQVSMKSAVLNASGDLPAVPTALVDALAKQNGILVEALGPVVTLNVNIERYPLGEMKAGGAPPIIEAHAKAQRAQADLRGTIRSDTSKQPAEMIFVSETPIKITVVELTQTLAQHFVKGLPVIGSVEKTKQEAAGLVTASNMTVPLGDDMSRLNGDVVIDAGEARFGTSGAFASILKTIKQKQAGTVGHRLQPLTLTIKSGVVTYARWKVPLGDFDVETEGTVDLVKRQLNVVTWLPFGALTDQAAGSFNTGLGALLGKAAPPVIDSLTMVPFRTNGSLDNPSTKPDLELFGKNVIKTISPERLIKENLGGLLDKVKPGGK
jgi:hypothetical protein